MTITERYRMTQNQTPGAVPNTPFEIKQNRKWLVSMEQQVTVRSKENFKEKVSMTHIS